MNFSVEILQTLVKLVQVEILELITSSATDNGMLVKSALTLNETDFKTTEYLDLHLQRNTKENSVHTS